jgi:hypothetical protein
MTGERRPERVTSLPLLADPTPARPHLSWTYLDKQRVKEQLLHPTAVVKSGFANLLLQRDWTNQIHLPLSDGLVERVV